MKTELTRERLEQARDAMIRRVIAKDDAARHRVRPPDFIRAMSDRELCEWDVELYELALRALERTDHDVRFGVRLGVSIARRCLRILPDRLGPATSPDRCLEWSDVGREAKRVGVEDLDRFEADARLGAAVRAAIGASPEAVFDPDFRAARRGAIWRAIVDAVKAELVAAGMLQMRAADGE